MSEALLAQTSQKLAILREASPSITTGVIDVGDAAEQKYGLRQAAAAFGLGSLRGGGMMQLFLLQTPKGSRHFYGQPFDGRMPLPGEHHIVLPIPIPAPAVFMDGFAGGAWKSPDPAFQAQLRKHQTSPLILRADFEWRLGAGTVKRNWLVQLRPTADGQTHLVMQGTGQSGVALDSRPVGFSTLTGLVIALMSTPPTGGAAPAAANFVSPSSFTEVFGQLRTAGDPPPIPRANLAGRELGQAIHQLLSAHAGGKLYLHPVPPKKEARARKEAMPADARGLPVIAMVDLTMMGSGADAIVFTPSHLFYRSGDDKVFFDWSEVRAVEAPVDAYVYHVRFLLAERGWIAIRCGKFAGAVGGLLNELAQIPA